MSQLHQIALGLDARPTPRELLLQAAQRFVEARRERRGLHLSDQAFAKTVGAFARGWCIAHSAKERLSRAELADLWAVYQADPWQRRAA